MTRDEHALIQALRLEMLQAFSGVQDSIVELTAEQRAHLAAHEERDKRRREEKDDDKESAITKRWVVGVVISTVGIAVAVTSLAWSVITKVLHIG